MIRGALACFRLEVRRGRNGLLAGLLAGGVLTLVNALHPLPSDSAATILLMVLPALLALFASLQPVGSVFGDRHTGRLALEQSLPQPRIVTAGGRLAGAGVRTLVAPALAAAVIVAAARHSDVVISVPLGIALALAVWMVTTTVCWALMAVNARWSLLRLWWVGTTLWLLPQFIPETWWHRGLAVVRPVFEALVSAWSAPGGSLLIAGLLMVVFLATGAAAAALYASGIRRYVHDADPLRLQSGRDRARPALEYPPGRRTVVVAVALHDVRLGIESLAKQWVVIAILVALAVLGPPSIAELAPAYIRILGYMVPGAVVVGLLHARNTGALALLQHLPHPRWRIASGKLVAIVALSVLAALIGVLGHRLAGARVSMNVGSVGTSALGIAGGVWVAAVLATWWRSRYLLWLMSAAACIGMIAMAMGPVDPRHLIAAAVGFPGAALVWFTATAIVGMPLFAHGLATYQKR